MTGTNDGDIEREGSAALSLMEEALELLDRCDCALAVGAQLDLAICRLRAHLGLAELAADGGPFEPQLWMDGRDSFAA